MALAVAEAHRVLRPGGHLLDIHPQGTPLRLELWQARSSQPSDRRDPEAYDRRTLGDLAPEAMTADFVASTDAIDHAARQGFGAAQTVTFDYRFFFDTLDELTDYLQDNDELDLAGDDLLEQALLALQHAATPAHLVLVQPVIVTRLEKK
jgi:hypothetical protein